MDRKVAVFLIALVLWGSILRVYDLDYHSYWMDESYSVLAAGNIGTYGVPMFDSGVRYLGQLPFSLVLFFFGLFGDGEFVMRLPSVIFGTMLIGVMFFYALKLLRDEYMALGVAVLVCFSEFFIAWSRQARHYSMFVLLFFVSLYLLEVFVSRPCGRNLLYLLVATVLAVMTHPAGLTLVFVYVLTAVVYRGKISFEMNLCVKALVFLIGGYVLYRAFLAALGLGSGVNYVAQYFLFFHEQHFAFLYLSIAGAYLLRRNRSAMILLFSGFMGVFVHSLLVSLFAYRYMLYLVPILFVFAVPALFFAAHRVSSRRVSFVLVVVFMVAAMGNNFMFMPEARMYVEPDVPQPDMRTALLGLSVDDDDTVIAVYTAVTEIYLRKPDYWLAFDFSRKGNVSGWLTGDGRDRYTGVPAIVDYEGFIDVVGSGHGYVIIDEMSLSRIDERIADDVKKMDLVFFSDDGVWTKVWVYEYG